MIPTPILEFLAVYILFGLYTSGWLCAIIGGHWMASLTAGSVWQKLACWLQILTFWPYISVKSWIEIGIENSVRAKQRLAERKPEW